MAIKIEKARCSGCYACVITCPQAALSIAEGKAQVDNRLCISCAICQQECLEKAITVLPGKDLGGGGY